MESSPTQIGILNIASLIPDVHYPLKKEPAACALAYSEQLFTVYFRLIPDAVAGAQQQDRRRRFSSVAFACNSVCVLGESARIIPALQRTAPSELD